MKKISVVLLSIFMFIFCFSGCEKAKETAKDEPKDVIKQEETTNTKPEEIPDGVTYTLLVNDTEITKNTVSVPAGDVVVSLKETIGNDVATKQVEGDFLSTAINKTILNIDYPTEETSRDGTVVTAYEYHLKEVPTGQIIHVTITKELQDKLALESDIIEICCE